MTNHDWDFATGYCTRCGTPKGWRDEGCLAAPNCHGMMHLLAKRKAEREKFPPPESS